MLYNKQHYMVYKDKDNKYVSNTLECLPKGAGVKAMGIKGNK